MERNNFIFLISLILSSIFAVAQPDKHRLIDSLIRVEKQTKEDTSRTLVLCELAIAHLGVDPEKSKQYATEAADLASRINYKKGQAAAYQNLGVAYHDLGKYTEAIDAYIKALKVREEMNDKIGSAPMYNNIGNIYHFQGKLNEALSSYKQALAIYLNYLVEHKTIADKKLEFNLKRGLGNTYSNIGNIFRESDNADSALANYTQALSLRKEINDKSGISICYICMGLLEEQKGNDVSAEKHHLAALDLLQQTGDKYNMIYSLSSLGNIYIRRAGYDKALTYLSKCLEITKELKATKDSIPFIMHDGYKLH
jgi:tetratricopeptide (TPR) repeat protein